MHNLAQNQLMVSTVRLTSKYVEEIKKINPSDLKDWPQAKILSYLSKCSECTGILILARTVYEDIPEEYANSMSQLEHMVRQMSFYLRESL